MKNLKYLNEKIKDYTYLIIITFFCSMLSPLNIWALNGTPRADSSVFKTVALHMQNGLMAYKDIFDHKGPLIYLYNWIGNEISYFRGIWIIEFVTIFMTFYFAFKTARLFCNSNKSMIVNLLVSTALIVFFDGGNLVEEYALPFMSMSLYFFIDYFLNFKINNLRLILTGFSFGAILMLRPNMIAIWLVFCVTVLVKCLKEHEIKNLVNFILWFLFGLLIIIVPIIIWLFVNGAFFDFVNDYIFFNLSYSNDSNRASNLNRINSLFYFLEIPLIIVALFIVLYEVRKNKSLFNIGYLCCFILTLLSISMSGMQFAHYGMIIIPLLVYPYAKLLSSINFHDMKSCMIFLFLCIVVSLDSTWISCIKNSADYYVNRNNYVERSNDIDTIVSYIANNTNPEDYITVFGNDNIFYVLSQRLSASKYSYQFPVGQIDLNIFQEYFDDLENNNPQIIIIDYSWVDNLKDQDYVHVMWNFIESNNYYKEIENEAYSLYVKQ